MAGRGPVPKPAGRRARRNGDSVAGRSLQLVREPAPELPPLGVDGDGAEVAWHPRTVAWWEQWSRSELAKGFSATDWGFLLDTALLHSRLWSGEAKLAGEVRLRVAKMGATPEDRARLRITFADADRADQRRAAQTARSAATGARDPRAMLHSQDGPHGSHSGRLA